MATTKKTSLEVSSGQITEQLIEIKERIAALETIASLANRKEVEAYVTETIKSDHARRILAACCEPRTKDQLKQILGFTSVNALDHHLKHLRSDALVEAQTNEEGLMTLQWSPLFKRLPVRDRERILSTSSSTSKKRTKV